MRKNKRKTYKSLLVAFIKRIKTMEIEGCIKPCGSGGGYCKTGYNSKYSRHVLYLRDIEISWRLVW